MTKQINCIITVICLFPPALIYCFFYYDILAADGASILCSFQSKSQHNVLLAVISHVCVLAAQEKTSSEPLRTHFAARWKYIFIGHCPLLRGCSCPNAEPVFKQLCNFRLEDNLCASADVTGRLQLERRQTLLSLKNVRRISNKSREVRPVPKISRSSCNNTLFSALLSSSPPKRQSISLLDTVHYL